MGISESNATDLPAEVSGWLDCLNGLVASVQEWSGAGLVPGYGFTRSVAPKSRSSRWIDESDQGPRWAA